MMKFLIISDRTKKGKVIGKYLQREFYTIEATSDLSRTTPAEYDGFVFIIDPSEVKSHELSIKGLRHNFKRKMILGILGARSPETASKLLLAGADDVISCPFEYAELSARIRTILRRSYKKEKRKELGVLVVDPASREVFVNDRDIKLRNKEYEILLYLVENEGRAVPKESIMENVWDINADPMSNTLEVHVAYLRRKLGEAGNMIHTIRGNGYKLVHNKNEDSSH